MSPRDLALPDVATLQRLVARVIEAGGWLRGAFGSMAETCPPAAATEIRTRTEIHQCRQQVAGRAARRTKRRSSTRQRLGTRVFGLVVTVALSVVVSFVVAKPSVEKVPMVRATVPGWKARPVLESMGTTQCEARRRQ